jgi:hypothetical protein
MLNRNVWLLLVTLLASTAEAKGPVVRIEIRDGVHAPLVIADAAIFGRFGIWTGRAFELSTPAASRICQRTRYRRLRRRARATRTDRCGYRNEALVLAAGRVRRPDAP